MACDPNTLIDSGKDFQKLSEQDQLIAMAQLLCDVSASIASSSNVKTARLTTGAIGGPGSLSLTVPWATAFADTSYTVVASVLDSTAATASLLVVHVESIQAASVNVRVQNTSGAPITGIVHVIGIHD